MFHGTALLGKYVLDEAENERNGMRSQPDRYFPFILIPTRQLWDFHRKPLNTLLKRENKALVTCKTCLNQRGLKHRGAGAGDVGKGTEQSCYSPVL